MGFIKFIFVLLLTVPVAVVMIYLINNLNGKLSNIMKNGDKENSAGSFEKNETGEGHPGRPVRDFRPQYSREIERGRTPLNSGVSNGYRKRNENHSYDFQNDNAGRNESKTSVKSSISKRKRRKQRKDKRKVREKEK